MKNIQYNSEIIDMFDKHARNIMPEIQRTPDRNGISLDRENLSIKFEKIVSSSQLNYALTQLVEEALREPTIFEMPKKSKEDLYRQLKPQKKKKVFKALDLTLAAIVFNSMKKR